MSAKLHFMVSTMNVFSGDGYVANTEHTLLKFVDGTLQRGCGFYVRQVAISDFLQNKVFPKFEFG